MFQPEKLNVHKNDSESWDYTVAMSKFLSLFVCFYFNSILRYIHMLTTDSKKTFTMKETKFYTRQYTRLINDLNRIANDRF